LTGGQRHDGENGYDSNDLLHECVPLEVVNQILNGSDSGVQINACEVVRKESSDREAGLKTEAGVERIQVHGGGVRDGLLIETIDELGIAPSVGSVGDFNWPGASGTNWWADPREELVVVWMAQSPGSIRWKYRQMVNALVYQALADEVAAAAGLVSSKLSRTPVVLIKGLTYQPGIGNGRDLLRAPERDLFR
jgi:CubicO group peptidase (beta-lactamase class C family)